MFARCSPAKYVAHLQELQVPGYGQIAITRYVSANRRFGGAARGVALWQALCQHERNPADITRLRRGAARQVADGQGMPHHIIWFMSKVLEHRAALRTNADFAVPLSSPNPLQAICDEGIIGMDCNGFVGTCLAFAGVDPHFNGSPPEEFLQRFPLIDSVAEIRPLCVIVKANYQHVQIVEAVVSRSAERVVVDICQSTNSNYAKGPQVNRRLTIRLGPGSFAPADLLRAARQQFVPQARRDPSRATGLWAEFIAVNPHGNEQAYLRWLNEHLMLRNQTEGVAYRHHGAVFHLESGGIPVNEVSGTVFIGAMPRLEGVR